MAKTFNRAVKLAGEPRRIDSKSVSVLLYDTNNDVLWATGKTVATGAGYAHGAFFTKTDAGAGTKSLYENQGTSAVADFNLVGGIVAGEISLAQGSMLVGNVSGVGVALDIKTSGRIVVGNGTTGVSVAVSGDATLAANGALTVTGSAGAFTATGAVIHSDTTSLVGVTTVTAAAGVKGTVANTFYPVFLDQAQQAIDADGAITITEYSTAITSVTTTGEAFTLADSTVVGQVKRMQLVADGGSDAVVTFNGTATLTFADVGDVAEVIWNGTLWLPIALYNNASGDVGPAYAAA